LTDILTSKQITKSHRRYRTNTV